MPHQDDESDALSADTSSQAFSEAPPHELLIRDFSKVKDDPTRFREAVAVYTPFVESTHIPEVFQDLSEPSTDVSPPTLLLLLINCLPPWFERAKPKKADKSDQKSKQSSVAEADLLWLLKFIRDYIRLSASGLAYEDTGAIVRDVISFCQIATNEEEVTHGIEILFELSKRGGLSDKDLHRILTVLTATAKALSTVPKTLETYLHFLLTGSKGGTCLRAIEAFVAVPNRDNETEGLSYARGACRLLGAAIDYHNEAGEYVVDLPRFLHILCEAASLEIFRFSRDVLNACEAITASSDRRDQLLANGFSKIVTILHLCLKLRPPVQLDNTLNRHAQPSVLSISSTASNSGRPSIEGQLAKRQAQARSVGAQLQILWTQLNEEQKLEVNDYVLQYPMCNSETLVLACLECTFRAQVHRPEQPGWVTRLDWLEAHFVRDKATYSKSRVKAIELLGKEVTTVPIGSKSTRTTPEDAHGQGSAEAMLRVLAAFRKQCTVESDPSALEAMLDALPLMLTTMDGDASNDFAIRETIATLEGRIFDSTQTSESAVEMAKSLVSIFRELFTAQSKHTISAFESLINVAGTECKFPEARIVAMCVLFRVRCTSSGFVYLDSRTGSDYVAVMLCRTVDAAAENLEPNPVQNSLSNGSLLSSNEVPASKWMYDDNAHGLLKTLGPSTLISTNRIVSGEADSHVRLDIGAWLTQAMTCLQVDAEWETYSYVLVHLGSQLSNIKLFRSSLPTVAKLRQVIHEQLVNGSFKTPPPTTELGKHDVALCLFNILTPLIAYATIEDPEIDRSHWERQLVQAFMAGMDDNKYDGTFRGCVHALSVCSLEIPERVGREYPRILDNMTRVATKSHLSVHMLEFLSQVAILPEVHKHFNLEEKRKVFNLCIAVLNDNRDEQLKREELQQQGLNLVVGQGASRAQTPSRNSGLKPPTRSPYRLQMMQDVGVPLYASALAYHTMICWFLSLPMGDREDLAKEVITKLVWHNKHNEPMIDQQAEVFRDMMLRTTYSDLGETQPDRTFSAASSNGNDGNASGQDVPSAEETDGKIESASWLVGYSIVTIQTAGHTGRTQITKRQASGTTYATYQQITRQVPPHQTPSNTAVPGDRLPIEMLPQHIMLQLQATAAPMTPDEQPVPLPNDETVSRALRIFDLNATIDSHKAGVLFVGPGQTQQSEVMCNVKGSADYESFLSSLGYKVSLQLSGGLINPQGLRYRTDGEETIAWCDRVTEIVFLVPTMMPLDPEEECEWLRRWANVGNAYVNIVFDRSGQDWKLSNLQSQFNYVNIVITPADWNDGPFDTPVNNSNLYYRVQVMTKQGFPNISPVSDPKIVSASQLARFVRVLAISACVFSQAWEKKDEDREFHSPWRDRLIAIKELRKKYAVSAGQQDSHQRAMASASQSANASVTSGRRTPVPRDEATTGQDTKTLTSGLDFTAWMRFRAIFDRSK